VIGQKKLRVNLKILVFGQINFRELAAFINCKCALQRTRAESACSGTDYILQAWKDRI
jgi:hypothetical protein